MFLDIAVVRKYNQTKLLSDIILPRGRNLVYVFEDDPNDMK